MYNNILIMYNNILIYLLTLHLLRNIKVSFSHCLHVIIKHTKALWSDPSAKRDAADSVRHWFPLPWSWTGQLWCVPRLWSQCQCYSCTRAHWSVPNCALSCSPLFRSRPGCSQRQRARTACKTLKSTCVAYGECRNLDPVRIPPPAAMSKAK